MDNKTRQQTEPKQVIVVNRNLNMPHGKLAAQVAHASLGALFQLGQKTPTSLNIDFDIDSAADLWVNGRFTKIVLYVKSEEALKKVYENAQAKGLPSVLIQDAGFTVFNGKPTYTCVGIGPAFPDEFIGVTDRLRVL